MTHTEDSRSLADENARSELYALLHRSVSPKQAIDRVVEIGTEYLDIDHGHITNIDEAEDRWEVIGSTDPPEGPYPAGLTAQLSDSYCRRTTKQSTPLALHDAGNQGWAEDHAYQKHQLETYLGIRIEVFDELYGTICFVESDVREDPFSVAEQVFIELAGQILQKTLEQTHHERDLANRDRLISVLNRVLRHNLRNDLNVVRGYAQMLKEQGSGDEAQVASVIDSKTTGVLSLADKSRELERLTRSVPVPRPLDIVPLVTETVADTRKEYPTVEVSCTTPDEAMAFAAPQLATAVTELLTNAAEHAGTDPRVAILVQCRDEHTTIAVEDNGPGLPSHERRILIGESETALEHGSGLGLSLVYWVLTNLDGEIAVTASSSGTVVEVHLQRAKAFNT